MKTRLPSNFVSPFRLMLLAGLFFLGAFQSTQAQVLVYKIEFKKSANSINFDFFDEAFFVVDGLGGEGSFIFMFEEGGRDFYLTAADAGELFFATKPGAFRAVIRASSDNSNSLSHYMLVGALKSSITVKQRGQTVRFSVASTLRGTVLASDPEEDVDESTAGGVIGFAGSASAKATLQRFKTRSVNKLNQTVADAVADLVEELERKGFSNAAPVEPTTTTTTTTN